MREGAGWRLPRLLRRYVEGAAWVGASAPSRVELPTGRDAQLLPSTVPVRGRNVIAVELRDVLQRPVSIVDDSGRELPRQANARCVIADFWWNDGEPELVGAEVLVEHGQPARFRVRFPLPFRPADRAQVRLGLAGSVIEALQIEPVADTAAEVRFEVRFEVWSVAAGLDNHTREAFADQLESGIDARVRTPAGSYQLRVPLRTTRSTLVPLSIAQLADVAEVLGEIRLLPVLAPSGPFAEPVPPVDAAPPRSTFRPQVAVDVRNMADVMLQDRELDWRQARALVAVAATLSDQQLRGRCAHADDALGVARLLPQNLLPPERDTAPGEAAVVGVDFFQAYTLTRLLGVAVAGDPELFRLPLGCELELAAYGGADGRACNAVAAHGQGVDIGEFDGLAEGGCPPTRSRRAGDVVPTAYGEPFIGLDFGVREWVFDLPHVLGEASLLAEWLGEHSAHLRHVREFARSGRVPGANTAGPLRRFGVVRGLAFGEPGLLIGRDGRPLVRRRYDLLPAVVPGVLRTEQLHRDGTSLLTPGRDPRLQHVGLRVAADARAIARLWGGR